MTVLNPETTALVMIDLQHGITALPVVPHSSEQVIGHARTIADQLRQRGGTVIWVRVGWSKNFADALRQPVDQAMPAPANGLPADWSELVDDLAHADDLHILKHQWGAFFGTELDLQLRRRGIRTVILGGIATNFGVESTARQGWEHGYELVLVEDASSSLDASLHGISFQHILPRLGRVQSTAQVLASLAG